MTMGGFGRGSWHRDRCGDCSPNELFAIVWVSLGYFAAIWLAVVAAESHPVLRVWLPGCFAAGVLAGSAGLAYGIASYGQAGQANLCRPISFGMGAVYVGILFELKTGVFTHWILSVNAGLD